MSEKIIKSADRVKDIGEVFTPKRIVNMMLDQPEITAKINDLEATFLEPSAGEGAFLVELLKRKLAVAEQEGNSIQDRQDKFLLALSTLYGIELMEDNLNMLITNMRNTFQDLYNHAFSPEEQDNKVVKSANTIIVANMLQGDALKRVNKQGMPLIFSEWKPLPKGKVMRTEFTFDSILENGPSTGTVSSQYEQLDLFSDSEDESKKMQFQPCKWHDIYKEKLK